MPKRPANPCRVNLLPIKRGDTVAFPAPDGVNYVNARAPEHGVYLTLGARTQGLFVSARQLWAVLDEVIDIDSRDEPKV